MDDTLPDDQLAELEALARAANLADPDKLPSSPAWVEVLRRRDAYRQATDPSTILRLIAGQRARDAEIARLTAELATARTEGWNECQRQVLDYVEEEIGEDFRQQSQQWHLTHLSSERDGRLGELLSMREFLAALTPPSEDRADG